MASIVLITQNGCTPCDDVKKRFEEKYATELKAGDAEVVNIDERPDVAEFATENGLGSGTHLLVVSDEGKLMAKLDADKELPLSGPTPLPAVVAAEG